jgi:hypothetical protein
LGDDCEALTPLTPLSHRESGKVLTFGVEDLADVPEDLAAAGELLAAGGSLFTSRRDNLIELPEDLAGARELLTAGRNTTP